MWCSDQISGHGNLPLAEVPPLPSGMRPGRPLLLSVNKGSQSQTASSAQQLSSGLGMVLQQLSSPSPCKRRCQSYRCSCRQPSNEGGKMCMFRKFKVKATLHWFTALPPCPNTGNGSMTSVYIGLTWELVKLGCGAPPSQGF